MPNLEALFEAEVAGAKEEGMSLLGHLTKVGLTGIKAKTGLAIPFDEQIMAAMPDGAEAVDGAISLSGELVPGPDAGGSFLERPIAGALADASEIQSLILDYDPGAQLEALAGQGKMLINGIDIDVDQIRNGLETGLERGLDAAEQFMDDPANTAIGAVQNGMISATDAIHHGVEYASQNAEAWLAALGFDPSQMAHGMASSASGLLDSFDGSPEELAALLSTSIGPVAGAAISAKLIGLLADRQNEKITEIEFQRAAERTALEIEHHVKLQEALRVGDTGHTETEVNVAGASTKISTDFEARDPDEDLEKKEGEQHLRDAIRSPNNDVQLDLQHMHMRSHLEENDRSITRTRYR